MIFSTLLIQSWMCRKYYKTVYMMSRIKDISCKLTEKKKNVLINLWLWMLHIFDVHIIINCYFKEYYTNK